KLLNQVQKDVKARSTPTAFYLFNAKNQLKQGPEDTRQKLLDTPGLKGKVPKGWKVLAVPQNETVVSCDASPTNGCPGAGNPAGTFYYLFKFFPARAQDPVPEANGNHLNLSAIKPDISTQGQGNIVQLGFK